MKKPRVLIADTDAAYTIPLQLKFVDAFFNQIDLEIITDQAYFEQLFATPQSLDVLIVSEELYNSGLQRHNIGHIFLMEEQPDESDATDVMNVNRLEKYSSIKEIFNAIVGKCGNIFTPVDNKKHEPQIVLVCSASGGVGKTTVALGLCAALAKNYKRVLYINADRLQTFQAWLSNPAAITSGEVYTKLLTGSKNPYADVHHTIREEVFQYLPPFKAALMSLGLPYSVFLKIAVSAKAANAYDYVVIDADCSFDEEKTRMIDAADRVIVVTGQKKAAVHAANRLYESVSGAAGEKFVYICNDFSRDADNYLIDPFMNIRFSINEYIQHIEGIEKKNLEGLSREKDIQKLAYLLL